MFYALGRGKIFDERVLDVRFAVLSRINPRFSPCHRLLDSVVQRGTAVPLSYPDCYASLLSHAVTFRQDPVGPKCSSPRFCVSVEGRRGEVWRYTAGKSTHSHPWYGVHL